MKAQLLLLGLAGMLAACQTLPTGHINEIRQARITWYHNHEDRFGSKTACGIRAQEGRTVAANASFRFGTKLKIPALKPIIGSSEFVVEDRGHDVESRKAAVHGEPVFDVYLWTKTGRQGRERMKQLGRILTHADVFITN